MKNKLFNKIISALLIMIFLSGMFPVNLFSQPQTYEVRGFNKSVFDFHFSRADREINPERWFNEAFLGLKQAICAWELSVSNLYDSQLLFTEAKNELEKQGIEELEKRFSQWLLNRFFGKAAEDTITDLLLTFDDIQKYFSWQLDEAGNIIFDDKTGDPLIIRPHETGREFTDDLFLWNSEARDILNYTETSFDSLMISFFPELLGYIPLELRETMTEIIYSAAADRSGSIKRDFEIIAEREERIFTSRRTRDIWSLRSKSENEAARLFTERLIAETENECKSGIEELNIRIEQAAANTGDLAILGNEWLRIYKEQFDRGLKAWEEAEERFFIRRIEWEQESFLLYSEGEKIWLDSFNQFEEERRRWELKAKELFEAGEMMFKNLSDDFERKMTEAKKEFELNMEMRTGEGTARVKALVDMYLICSSMAVSASENITFWLAQYNTANKPDPKDLSFSAWLANEIKKNPQNNILSEIKYSHDTHVSYMEKALDARNRILENYAELLGTGLLKDILSPGASSEDFFLDEYQIALIRAKALVVYWERKTAIAEAVMDYANELSSGRMTESEGLRAWKEAKAAYDESLAVYETELNKLTIAGADVRKQQELLYDLMLLMQKEEESLNRLNSEYSAFVSSAAANNSGFNLQDFNIKYNNLSQTYNVLLNTRDDAIYRTLLENGIRLSLAEQRETAEEILSILERSGELSLSEEEIELLNSEYALLSRNYQEVMWNNTINSLSSLFYAYGLKTEINQIPGINNICEMIFSRPGDFIQNAAEFLLEFDACFITIPQWLDYETSLWKNAVIQHIAVYAIYNNLIPAKNIYALHAEYEKLSEDYFALYDYASSTDYADNPEADIINEGFNRIFNSLEILNYMNIITELWENISIASAGNEKHWRQFLINEHITVINSLITPSSSWKEGVFFDSLFNAVYFTNRINDSFLLLSQKDLFTADESSAYYYMLYSEDVMYADYILFSLVFQHNDLFKSAQAYELSMLTPEETEKQISKKLEESKLQEIRYNSIRNQYFNEAEKMILIGSLYDSQYIILNKAYEISDQKRHEYEKQDAIQRWAGTAYLNTDNIDPEGSRLKLEKARTVLNVLSDLYNNETKRSYDNPEYNELYIAYEQTFYRKIKVLEAYELIISETEKEYINNKNIYTEYTNYLSRLGYIEQNYSGYISPVNRSQWSLKDIITVKDGRVVFSRDSSMKLTGINESKADELDSFFNDGFIPAKEQFEISLYEESIRELSQRMAGYLTSMEKFTQWSLARDYLIYSLIKANGDLSFLKNYFSGIGELDEKGSLRTITVSKIGGIGNMELYSLLNEKGITEINEDMFRDAWNRLSAEEKADLEFYTILTLTGNKKEYSGFSLSYTLHVYNQAYNVVDEAYRHAKWFTDSWWLFFISWLWIEMRDVNKNAMGRINSVLTETNSKFNEWHYSLRTNLSSISNIAARYKESCNKLSTFENIKKHSPNIEWNDINLVLAEVKALNTDDIAELKTFWESMLESSPSSFSSVYDALTALLSWTNNEEKTTKDSLEKYWNGEKQNQIQNEYIFQEAVDAYINGTINEDSLKSTAVSAYGENAASIKNHLGNMHTVMLNNLSVYSALDLNLYSQFITAGDDLISLTENTMKSRYYAELSAKETEWQQTLRDIAEKFFEWQNTSALILENGRADWIKSAQKIEEAYRQWNINFNNEYERVSYEWTNAYLAGLEDKERWLQQAEYAANNASSQSFLSLIGTEAERLSRVMDTREPFGMRNAAPQAQSLMTELLQLSGITNMQGAFSSLNNTANISSPAVKRGMGGVSIWNTAAVKTAASDLARKTNSEIADNEARKLAFSVRITADDAVKFLTENIESANRDFRANMDDIFVFNGLWKKSGSNYVKEVLKGSTLFTPVISETVTITGYENYRMNPVVLKTNMDENYLAVLDSLAINILLENIYAEVQAIAEDIFGIGRESIKINNNGMEREQSPGKFGAHIGYAPADKLAENAGKTREEIFYDEGAGELGRLMSEFLYWHVIDILGTAELSLAPWDRRMWDDEGSWFKAPTLRSVGTIAGSIIAGVTGLGLFISVGISTVSDVVFGTLDVAFGHKNFDEALFDVGKSFLTNAVGSLVSGGANLLSDIIPTTTNSFINITGKTLIAGAQSALTGLASSAISGITYNSVDGFGYNGEIFKAGLNNVLTNTLTSVTSAFTTSSLTAINSGFDLGKLLGFNGMNKSDLQTLNGLLGSLAGEGVSYAMGNDFKLNLLRFTSDNYSSGLLELNLGRGGVSMSIGTGGADVSFNNITSAFRGAFVWGLNTQISAYGKNNDFDALIALRAQYGYGDNIQKNQLFGILNGDVLLNTGTTGDYEAQTTILDGQRMISITGYHNKMSAEDQFYLATVLGHEAYRDGYVTDDNYIEARTATMAHTQMAIKMIISGEKITYNNNLSNDIFYFLSNDRDLFNAYVDNNYDSSGDFWKLVLLDNNIGFEWDNKLEYDLSVIGLGDSIETLDEYSLMAMYNLCSGYNDFNDFKTAVGMFDTLNTTIINFERTFSVDPEDTVPVSIFQQHWKNFIGDLNNVGNSGLFAETNARVMEIGEGPHVFANGYGVMTSNYGWRLVTWKSVDYGKPQKHFAWDLGARGKNNSWVNIDSRLVAPMDGILSVEFNQGHGIQLVTKGENNESITYSHSNASSIRNFIELYSYKDVNLFGNELTGIKQNMIIGEMGNTGNLSANAHVDVIYKVGNTVHNPAEFFYRNENAYVFPINDDYTRLMSGLSTENYRNNVNLSIAQINGIYDYFNNGNNAVLKFNFLTFGKNTNNYNEFISVLTQRMMRGVQL